MDELCATRLSTPHNTIIYDTFLPVLLLVRSVSTSTDKHHCLGEEREVRNKLRWSLHRRNYLHDM